MQPCALHSLNIRSGFLQVYLTERARYITGFVVPSGRVLRWCCILAWKVLQVISKSTWSKSAIKRVANLTVRKCWFSPGTDPFSAVIHQSLVISPGLKVSDPVLEVGDGCCPGDIPPSPRCVTSRPHEHSPGGAVPSGTVSDHEGIKRPPRYRSVGSA